MKISAVICTYNRYDVLEKAIDSVAAQSLQAGEFETIIVDNSPQNETGDALKARYADAEGVTYHIEPTPGLSNARNVGAGMAQADIVAYLDDDAIADKAWLEQLVSAFEMFPNAAVVGGRINPMWEIPRPHWLHDRMLGMLTVVDWGGVTRVAAPHEWVAGANVSFRRAPLLALGGFNTSLGRTGGGAVLLSNEESAVIDQLKAQGYDLVYCPDAEVDHLVEAKRLKQDWIRRRMAWQAVSEYIRQGGLEEERAPAMWMGVAQYFNELELTKRTPASFFAEASDKDEFNRQISAIYAMIMLMLAGASDVDRA